jgi:hypothetical protein
MKRGMGAAIAAITLGLGWGVAQAETGTVTGGTAADATAPGTVQPVAPPTAQGDINIEVKPGTLTSPATTKTTTTTPGGGTTTTTTPGDVKVEVEPPPGQPAPGVDVNVNAPPPPVAVPPPDAVPPGVLEPESQPSAMSGAVTESTLPVAAQPIPDPGARPYDARYGWTSRIGAGLLLGGGVEDFTNNNMQTMTGTGGAWNARVVAGTRQIVGVEAAYQGAARNISTLGLSNDAVLLNNGVEGALRLNIPIIRSRTLVEPFGFVGLGWSHYQITNTNTNTSSLAGTDDIMAVPFGGGLAMSYGAFMADARFTYRQTYYNDLVRTGGGNLNTWNVGGQVGFAF